MSSSTLDRTSHVIESMGKPRRCHTTLLCTPSHVTHVTTGLAVYRDVFLTPGHLALAFEYADLGTLRDYMGRCGRQVHASTDGRLQCISRTT